MKNKLLKRISNDLYNSTLIETSITKLSIKEVEDKGIMQTLLYILSSNGYAPNN